MLDFDGRVVLVTGSATGLGAAIALGSAQRGAKAVIWNDARSGNEAEETADACRTAAGPVAVIQADVGEDGDCIRLAAAAAPFGRIDALANNAGITKHAQRHGDLDALSSEDFQRLYRVNVIGPFQMVRAARALLEASDGASVLMISSIAGVAGIGSSVAYAASKGALNTMTLSLARALAPKIRVNALCPGFIDTRWFTDAFGEDVTANLRQSIRASTPLQAASQPEDIADAALFFLSRAARHVTGETLLVDAGMHLGFTPLSAR